MFLLSLFSFFFESERGLFPNTEFVYDLELPVDFIPKNADGEVETFELLPADQCLKKILTNDFKTTSTPVALDFLIRHGVVTAENGEFLKESTLHSKAEKKPVLVWFTYFGVRNRQVSNLFFVSETEYLRIIELLHVPLQSIYSTKTLFHLKNEAKENGTQLEMKM